MTRELDLADIQGNIVRPYGRFGFPVARYLLLHVANGKQGCRWLSALLPRVTTATTWGSSPGMVPKPLATLNIAINHAGLAALKLPRESLDSFPPEFVQGMKKRKDILGDDGPSSPWPPASF